MALTLVSRISGMARDAVCSRVFGGSAIWSAFVTAFIVPNLFRRLFGEGALSAAFIPEYAQLVKRHPKLADRFALATASMLLMVLGAIVVVAELALAGVLLVLGEGAGSTRHVVVLTMVMLPFAPLVCVTAMFGGMLQTHGRFVPHAASPVILNLAMIAGAATLAFWLDAPLTTTALGLSLAVLVAGVLQLAWCAWSLRGVVSWRTGIARVEIADRIRAMLRRMVPVLIGMGTLQLGTLIDSLLAGWPVIVGPTLPGGGAYPMDAAAAGMLFFASRLYQFPLGVFGIAIATAVFPALARQADEPGEFGATLRRGIRMSLFIGLPATLGLLLVARDASGVIYLGGEFQQEELDRVTRILVAYAPAVWAYSLMHVFTRAFYAVGNTGLPMRVGIVTVCLNLTLNFSLMWTLGEAGLALATSVAAIFQAIVLGVLASHRLGVADRHLADRATLGAVVWCVLAGGAMVGVILLARRVVPVGGEGAWGAHAWGLGRDLIAGGATYLGLAVVCRRREFRWLLERSRDRAGRRA
jgi:putative peptidoglycan lipid II flippase